MPRDSAHVLHQSEIFPQASVVATDYQVDGQAEAHTHDFLELALIYGGVGVHRTARGDQRVSVGDLFVLRPGSWHAYCDCRKMRVAHVDIASSVLSGPGGVLLSLRELHDLLWVRPTAAGNFGIYAMRLPKSTASEAAARIGELMAWAGGPGASEVRMYALLLSILGQFVEHAPARDFAEIAHPAVDAAITRMTAALDHDWHAWELARSANLDPAYLSRLFVRHVGLPPIAYLARIRAERAAELLFRTGDSISSIGAEVGWPNPTYFARRFRQFSGLTPSDYRARIRAGPDVAWLRD